MKPKVSFDHINVVSHSADETRRFFSEALGLEPGWRPNFGFPGAWLYRDTEAYVHITETSDPHAGVATLNHIAFRTDETPGALVERLRALGYAPQLARVPDTGAVQVFVQLPGGLVVEIDTPPDPAA